MECNKIYFEDCLDTMEKMPDNFLDCIVTSPPYFNAAKKYQRGSGIHYVKDVGEPMYTMLDVFDKSLTKLKEGGFFCINLGYSYGETGVMRPFHIMDRAQRLGLFVVDVIIWKKRNPIPLQRRLTNSFEYIFVLSKHPNNKYPSADRIGYKHNFIETSVKSGKGHSAVYPIEVPRFCIDTFSNEGDLVYDPFMGSGTTAIACVEMKRNYIGSEIASKYIEMSNERIKKYKEADNQIKIF
jgi:DNA modification methylase